MDNSQWNRTWITTRPSGLTDAMLRCWENIQGVFIAYVVGRFGAVVYCWAVWICCEGVLGHDVVGRCWGAMGMIVLKIWIDDWLTDVLTYFMTKRNNTDLLKFVRNTLLRYITCGGQVLVEIQNLFKFNLK